MKEKIKNLSFPALLLLIVAVAEILSLNLAGLFRGSIGIGTLLYLAKVFSPAVLFYFLYTKEDQKDLIGKIAFAFGCITLIDCLRKVRTLFIAESFIEALVLNSAGIFVVSVMTGILLLILGSKLMKDQTVSGKYYLFCGITLFLAGFVCMIMAIASPLAILSKLPTFLLVLSLFYLPKLYIPSECHKTRVSSKKITAIAIAVVVMYMILGLAGGLSSDTGYWGSDGYYHPSQSEAEQARQDANDWMKENWYK